MATVRQFSRCGPCITLGEFIKMTPSGFFVFRDRYQDGKVSRIKGRFNGDVHKEPCHSCRDHERSQYPNGYED